MAGIYIHVPFCKSRCIYCDFYSTTALALRQRYVDALCREYALRRTYINERVRTIYIGGGTPSMLSADQLRQVFTALAGEQGGEVMPERNAVVQADEVTLECNPDDVTPAFARALASLPVNRVSMGAQTFSDSRLQFLRRRHRASQVKEAVGLLRQAGIGNISIDLIYGFPGESIAEWYADIDAALDLGVEHLSAYALQYEEGTPLYRLLQQGAVSEVDEELSRRMYYDLIDRLAAAGFEHYEISNFARPGFRSRHNSGYWNHTPYLGLGAAAHSFDGHCRQWNVADVQAYIEGVEQWIKRVEMGTYGSEQETPFFEREEMDADTFYNEQVMTALRTREGLALSFLQPPYRDYCLRLAERYVENGLLKRTDDHIALTREGLFVSDMVISDLMKV